MARDSIADQSLHAHFTVTRSELYPAARLDAALCRQRRRYFDKGAWRLLANALSAVRHVALMEVFQQPSIVQVQVIFCVGLICRFVPFQRVKASFAVRELE